MNNSLYKITFYFFICIFVSSCGFSLFNNSKDNSPSENSQKQIAEERENAHIVTE